MAKGLARRSRCFETLIASIWWGRLGIVFFEEQGPSCWSRNVELMLKFWTRYRYWIGCWPSPRTLHLRELVDICTSKRSELPWWCRRLRELGRNRGAFFGRLLRRQIHLNRDGLCVHGAFLYLWSGVHPCDHLLVYGLHLRPIVCRQTFCMLPFFRPILVRFIFSDGDFALIINFLNFRIFLILLTGHQDSLNHLINLWFPYHSFQLDQQ